MQQAEKLLFNGQADEALALFSKEAENGNGRAMYFLGFILEHGLGHTAQDEDKAAAWFEKGQKAGDALAAARWLGMDDRYHLLTDAFPKARAMAEDNDCFAKVELADMYLSGGIMINFEEGIHLLSQACAMGYWYALEKMGDLCQEGLVVDKNEARAFAFYSKAGSRPRPLQRISAGMRLVRRYRHRYGQGKRPFTLEEGMERRILRCRLPPGTHRRKWHRHSFR